MIYTKETATAACLSKGYHLCSRQEVIHHGGNTCTSGWTSDAGRGWWSSKAKHHCGGNKMWNDWSWQNGKGGAHCCLTLTRKVKCSSSGAPCTWQRCAKQCEKTSNCKFSTYDYQDQSCSTTTGCLAKRVKLTTEIFRRPMDQHRTAVILASTEKFPGTSVRFLSGPRRDFGYHHPPAKHLEICGAHMHIHVWLNMSANIRAHARTACTTEWRVVSHAHARACTQACTFIHAPISR